MVLRGKMCSVTKVLRDTQVEKATIFSTLDRDFQHQISLEGRAGWRYIDTYLRIIRLWVVIEAIGVKKMPGGKVSCNLSEFPGPL